VDKVNRRTLPAGATVQIVRHGPTEDVFLIDTPEGFVLRLYTFMFAGWRASVNGQPVEIEVAKPEGFITVPVPSGEHTVRVWLGGTPARTWASAISLMALITTAVIAWRWPARATTEEEHASHDTSLAPSLIGVGIMVAVAAIGGFANAFQPHSTGLIPQPARHVLYVHLQGGADLIGFDAPKMMTHPGDTIPVTLFWKAREPIGNNYQVFVHLTSEPQHTWGQSDKLNPGEYPTTRWPLDRYVRDPHAITIPLGTPPGSYTLRVGLWDHNTGARQLVIEPDGRILGDSVALPVTITVLPPPRPAEIDELPLLSTPNVALADELTLLGVSLPSGPDFDAPAGWWTLALYWRCEAGPLPDYTVALRLLDQTGAVVLRQDEPPVEGRYLMPQWSSGEVVRDLHSFWIGEDLPEGPYSIEMAVCSQGECNPTVWTAIAELSRLQP
jgi:hypothetical protein